MKKIILMTILSLFLLPVFAYAEILPYKLYAISHNTISSSYLQKENNELSFQSLDRYFISELEYIEKNAIITVKIKEYIKPKRGKRNGYLKVQLIQYTIPSEENRIKEVENMDLYGTLRLSTPKDKKEIAKSAGISVIGHILKVPGFSQAIAVSKGILIPNPDQNRLQSAGTNLYQSTPLTYAEVGEAMEIEEDSIVVMKLKNKIDLDE